MRLFLWFSNTVQLYLDELFKRKFGIVWLKLFYFLFSLFRRGKFGGNRSTIISSGRIGTDAGIIVSLTNMKASGWTSSWTGAVGPLKKWTKLSKWSKLKKMVIKDQIDQNGENWKMVIKDKNCLNDQKWSKIVKLTIMVKNDENSQNYKYGQNGRKWSKNSIGVQSWMAAPSLVGKFSGQVWWLSGLVG